MQFAAAFCRTFLRSCRGLQYCLSSSRERESGGHEELGNARAFRSRKCPHATSYSLLSHNPAGFRKRACNQRHARFGSERDLPDPARVSYAARERGYRPCGRRDRFSKPQTWFESSSHEITLPGLVTKNLRTLNCRAVRTTGMSERLARNKSPGQHRTARPNAEVNRE